MPTKKRVLAKTWEEFCKLTDRNPNEFPEDVKGKRGIADFKLSTMILYYNGKLPDYTDSSQDKYEPWWQIVKDKKRPSGFGLSFNDDAAWLTYTYVGPRFAYFDPEVLRHVTKYFIEEYNDLIL
jgi:hypothetical protein